MGQEIHGRPAGSVMTVDFILNGVRFTALNGGPHFKFNEAVSLRRLVADRAHRDDEDDDHASRELRISTSR